MAAPPKNRLKDRWCLVTGASSGVGTGIAAGLASRGARLILCSRTQSKLEQVAEHLRSLGSPQVEIVAADLSSPAETDRLAEAVLALSAQHEAADGGKGLYMLVNNAGGALANGLSALSGNPDEWDALMHLNLGAPMRLTRRLAPAMVEAAKTGAPEGAAPGQGAVVINLGSVAGVEPITGFGVYSVTKAGLRMWSLSCYRDLRPHNVKVCVIQPGYVDTPLVSDRAGDRRRMIKVEDIAAAVLAVVDSSLACCFEELTVRPVLPVVPPSAS